MPPVQHCKGKRHCEFPSTAILQSPANVLPKMSNKEDVLVNFKAEKLIPQHLQTLSTVLQNSWKPINKLTNKTYSMRFFCVQLKQFVKLLKLQFFKIVWSFIECDAFDRWHQMYVLCGHAIWSVFHEGERPQHTLFPALMCRMEKQIRPRHWFFCDCHHCHLLMST